MGRRHRAGNRRCARLSELRALTAPVVAIVRRSRRTSQPALAAGARGVVLRDQVGPGIHAALAAVRSGLTVIDTALARALVPAAPVKHQHRQRSTAS